MQTLILLKNPSNLYQAHPPPLSGVSADGFVAQHSPTISIESETNTSQSDFYLNYLSNKLDCSNVSDGLRNFYSVINMRYLLIFFTLICIDSCNTNLKEKSDNSLKDWIVSHRQSISSENDSIIQDYYKHGNLDPNWTITTIAITKYGPDVLSTLAKKAGDSIDCIVVELTFYKDLNKKKKIMIASADSTCTSSLTNIVLDTDSTDNFIFGKQE